MRIESAYAEDTDDDGANIHFDLKNSLSEHPNLEILSTGGNMDYVVRKMPSLNLTGGDWEYVFWLLDPDDGSPEPELTGDRRWMDGQPAIVILRATVINDASDYDDIASWEFPCIHSALIAMNTAPAMASINQFAEHMRNLST